MNYERIGKFSLAEVLPFVVRPWDLRRKGLIKGTKGWKKRVEREYCGKKVIMTILRYRVFKNDHVCQHCGLVGTFFGLERHARGNSKKYHLNLYGYDNAGNEVMLTKDHIIPTSRGGSYAMKNLQTLCKSCNEKKADEIPA